MIARAKPVPVVFACSCSASAGRLAAHVSAVLDARGDVEATPVAEIEAGSPQALGKARARFPIVALDGCADACARRCLERHGVTPAEHYVLTAFGIENRAAAGFAPAEADKILVALASALG